jgi:cardiolipin synthase A/B
MARRKAPIYPPPRPVDAGEYDGAVERLLAANGVPPVRGGNRLEIAADGHDAYARILDLLKSARSSIHITTYILGRDAGSRALVETLTARAREGVEVRLLVDDFGSWWVRRPFVAPLIEAGGQVAHFMPVLHAPFRGRANLRNHRKLVIVDSQFAVTGGTNLAWPYIGPPEAANLWLDLSVIVEGPAVADLEAVFISDWRFATGSDSAKVTGINSMPGAATMDSCALQVVASGPDVPGDPLYEALLAMIFAARERIWIVTPYFVPDEMLSRALALAARRGVDVRLVVPMRSNHLTADLARASYLRDLHNAGGHVLLYTPTMLHAKAVVFDDQLAVIGSANMDMRSLFLNYEVALFLASPTQVGQVADWSSRVMVDCKRELPAPNWPRELAENVVRLLSPLL